jgi:hypothetical protein
MVNTLNIEDMLEGETIFWAWKDRILLLLEENDLKEYVEGVVPSPTNPHELLAHVKKVVKAKRVLLDSVKDHMIPHIYEKKIVKDVYGDLVCLYQSENVGRKFIFKNQLQAIKMSSSDTVVSYLMRINQIHDQLATINEELDDDKLVNMALSVLPRSWEPFL